MLIYRTTVESVIHTPAKINLFFEIAGQRDDGFHEIETLMVPISLYDTLRFRPNTDGNLRLQCRLVPTEMPLSKHEQAKNQAVSTEPSLTANKSCLTANGPSLTANTLGSEKDNLVVRAVALLRHHAGVETGADLELIKRIPIAAGLGGGSSDAAAALVAANQQWKLGWSRSQLAEVAAELGSDVAFFLYGKAAVCRGRGEIVEPIDHSLSCPVVVLRPPVGLSTADVYATYRSTTRSDEKKQDMTTLLDAFQKRQLENVGRSLFNRLESVAAGTCSWIKRMADALEQEGEVGHQMSGSGSCYFGLFPTWKQARIAARRLQSKQLGNAYVVQMGQRSSLC